MKYRKTIFYWINLVIFLLLGNSAMYSQEWQAWSEWEKSYLEDKLSHRQRVKYTSQGTYALQLEWKNKSSVEKEIRFEVRDNCSIAEVTILTIPGKSTRVICAGNNFLSRRIKLYLLKPELSTGRVTFN